MSAARDRPALVWFRQDLRLADNPALAAASASGAPLVALYVLEDEPPGRWCPGGAGRWWRHHSLAALAGALTDHGVPLVLRRGDAGGLVAEVAESIGAGAVYWNRCYEPHAVARDRGVKSDLAQRGLTVRSANAALLVEPWDLTAAGGAPYKVFTPFWKALRARASIPPPGPAPERLRGARVDVPSDRLDDWALLPRKPDWAAGLRASWNPGEAGARARLGCFLDAAIDDYGNRRDRPDRDGTARLSPHLHWGEIGPRQVWHATRQHLLTRGTEPSLAEPFLRQLAWRDFCTHLAFASADIATQPIRPEFAQFPWRDDNAALEAWQRGRTGYPLVDAGMRQLWATGWMHNRVRMVAASLLVKHLLVPWQRGEAWFRDTLVDADLASNAANWQWVAGCGADAAPFFRIFNPVTQGRKFDPGGRYVRQWVPELAALPDATIHAPWQAADSALAEAGVRLGETYPRPIVDHGAARARALAAFESFRRRP